MISTINYCIFAVIISKRATNAYNGDCYLKLQPSSYMNGPVRLSVRLSVRQRSKVKVTEVKTQYVRFRTVTQIWIHRWLPNDA